MLSRGLTSLLDSGKNKVSLGAGPAAAAALVLQASTAYPSPHRNTMLRKDAAPRLDVPSGSFWILFRTKRLQLLGLLLLLLLLLLLVVLLELMLQASKTHPSPHRNTMLLKDGTTSKNMLPRGLTSLLDPSGFCSEQSDCSCWACCCCCSCCCC